VGKPSPDPAPCLLWGRAPLRSGRDALDAFGD